jgi:hypothetical protein
VRLLIWLVPVLLMLAHNDGVAPLRALGLVGHWPRGVLVGVALAILLFTASWTRFGWPKAPYLTWNSLLGEFLGRQSSDVAALCRRASARLVVSASLQLAAGDNLLRLQLRDGRIVQDDALALELHHQPRRQQLRLFRAVSRAVASSPYRAKLALYNYSMFMICSKS